MKGNFSTVGIHLSFCIDDNETIVVQPTLNGVIDREEKGLSCSMSGLPELMIDLQRRIVDSTRKARKCTSD